MTLILQQILPHYRYEVLKYLPSSDFKILYSNTVKEGSLKSIEADQKNFLTVPIIKLGEKYLQFPFRYIIKFKPSNVVVTPELRNISFWILFILKFIFDYKLVSWTHGINNKDFHTGNIGFSGRIRLLMIKLSDLVITYSDKRADLLGKLTNNKITVANNTLDTRSLNSVHLQLSEKGKSQLFNDLGWSESEHHFIYVGRLLRDKNIEESILLFKEVSENVKVKCNFHIVGKGPYEIALKNLIEEQRITNISFHGQILDKVLLGSMLYASDLHLHLGYTGLAVVHSLCFGCPIVTTLPDKVNGPFHSPEFEYLDKNNSILSEDVNLSRRVEEVINSRSMLQQIKANARSTFENKCAIDHFLNTFLELERIS